MVTRSASFSIAVFSNSTTMIATTTTIRKSRVQLSVATTIASGTANGKDVQFLTKRGFARSCRAQAGHRIQGGAEQSVQGGRIRIRGAGLNQKYPPVG